MKKTMKERLIDFVLTKKISQREFERVCGFSYGFVSHLGDALSPKSQKAIQTAFPNLNLDWLLTGEGDMMLVDDSAHSSVVASGDSSTAVQGNNNKVNSENFVSVMNRAFDEIAAQRKLTEKRDEQIDRLLNLLEKKYEQ